MSLLSITIFTPAIFGSFAVVFRNFKYISSYILLTGTIVLLTEIISIYYLFDLKVEQYFSVINLLHNNLFIIHIEIIGIIFCFIIAILWMINTIYSLGYIGIANQDNIKFYFFVSLSITSAIGVALSANLITLLAFYEMLTISTYPLIIYNNDEASYSKSKVYMGILLFTSSFFLIFAIIYTYYGGNSLDFTSEGISFTNNNVNIAILTLLYLFGLSKIALFPFQAWLPAAMVAPAPVSALLHAVAVVKSGIFSIIKVLLYIIGLQNIENSLAGNIIIFISSFTILFASIAALYKDEIKSVLAYSTISQLSYITLSLGIGTPLSIAAGIIHTIMHAFGKITLFFVAGDIIKRSGIKYISQINNLGHKQIITGICLIIGSISIIGLPFTGGMLSKWLIINSSIEANKIIPIAILLIATILNISYFLPLIYNMFFNKNNTEINLAPISWLRLVPIMITSTIVICLFLFVDQVFNLYNFIIYNITNTQ